MKILSPLRTFALAAVAAAPLLTTPVYPQTIKQDTFEHTISASGSSSFNALAGAPSPKVKIEGVERNAVIVVDLTKNVLYKYDEKGVPEKAYLVASGKKSTPTHTGVRIVTHTETYPYRTAPKASKRRRAPRDYGPKIICLNKLDPKTGEQSPTGEFIHGNNNPASIGKYASHGCIRMDNEVIKQLSQEVKRGDIVIIK
ncbi:MAG: L,D-transpeptidase [Candidatus Gastranaerophilales bacterium]|nr:L,D-transpeptidase [Candidatus Gastranaerophilales bacterium]MCM1072427.1 L,D-transpeptidase [Bacteroides sp.]